MYSYPSQLPAFRASAYGYDEHDCMDRTEIQGAYEAASLRTRHSGATFHVSSRMTYCQLRLWEGFWAYRINRGHAWFLLTLDVGEGLSEHTARFSGATYTARKDGLWHWVVSGTVEADEKAVYSYEETMYAMYGEDLAGMLHELVHVTLPGIWG